MKDQGLLQFAEHLRQEILTLAEREDEEGFQRDVFTRYVGETLVEAGELEEIEVCYHRPHGMEVSGYAIDQDDSRLSLFVTIHTQEVPPPTVPRSSMFTAFRRVTSFLVRVFDGYHFSLEEASPVFDMAQRIYTVRKELRQVRLFVLSDGIATIDQIPDDEVAGIATSFHVWDLPRIHRCVTSGEHREAITIDFVERFGSTIPCLAAQPSADEYQVYLALIPAQMLRDLYDEYGARLLELNVRSFLQARAKVNAGIRETIIKVPHRFLAYNNGITATAEDVVVEALPTGGTGIRSVRNLQIVNGGQTTASLHRAVRVDRADLSGIAVQTKLVEVRPSQVQEVVPLISRFSNSQNRVQDADFSANDVFHVRLEELSRTIWAPARGGTQRQTRWFYERARGQYQDAIARESTPARKRQFREIHPTSQLFTKTDLAKFENTWMQMPHVVSRGAQKNFREFAIALKERGHVDLDAVFFHRLIARAILFRRAESIIQREAYGGYRANIVTYTLAYLSNRTALRIDLDRIWAAQDIGPGAAEAIRRTSRPVFESITTPPGGRNITEWCKNSACWQRICALEVELPIEFEKELLPVGKTMATAMQRGIEAPSPEEEALITEMGAVPPEIWFGIAGWGKETDTLNSWQRRFAYSMGQMIAGGRLPTRKQAAQAVKVLAAAKDLGFAGASPEEK